MDWKKLLSSIPWQSLLLSVYKDLIRPWIAKMVASSDAKWDDAVFAAADQLVEKLLGSLAGEKERAVLVAEVSSQAAGISA